MIYKKPPALPGDHYFKHFSGKIIKLSIVLFPSLLNLFLYILAIRGNMLTSDVSRSTLDYLFKDLFFFATVTFTPLQMFPAYLFLNVIMIGAYMSFRHFRSNEWRFTENTEEKRTLLIFIVMLVLIYFCMPFRFGGGSYFNERFPWVILLAGLPLLFLPETESRRKFTAFAGIAIAVIFWSCNVSLLGQQSRIIREYLNGVDEKLPRGAFVMTYKTKDAIWPRVDVLLHAASYYGIYDGCVDIGNYEAGLPYFPVQFVTTLPAFLPRNQIAYDPSNIPWACYPGIGYLLGWDLDTAEK